MPRWKTTEQIINLSKDGEFFDENWMNYDSIYQYIPSNPQWNENRPIKFEDVDLWEVIAEISGPIGIYAAWSPYAHYFVVMKDWTIIGEFWGIEGEKRVQKFMRDNGIHYFLNNVWIDDDNVDGNLI